MKNPAIAMKESIPQVRIPFMKSNIPKSKSSTNPPKASLALCFPSKSMIIPQITSTKVIDNVIIRPIPATPSNRANTPPTTSPIPSAEPKALLAPPLKIPPNPATKISIKALTAAITITTEITNFKIGLLVYFPDFPRVAP